MAEKNNINTNNNNNNNKNNNNNSKALSLDEENLLKDAMIFLQEEYNIKKEKLNILRQELSQTKKQFQNQLKEYQKETQLTIDKENEIQELFYKISKKKKKRALVIKNSFNRKFYKHLLDISTNEKKEKILKNFFSLILFENDQETRTVKDLITILKNEEEITNLLYYSYKIYYDLRKKDEKAYNELKNKFNNYNLELKELDGGEYPFDEMFECLGIIFEIIEYDNTIKENNIILNKLIEKKNAKFVEVKSIEHKIRNYYKNIKKIQAHIKKIHIFYDNFKELNSNNYNENILRELIDKIEEYKNNDFDYNNNCQNYDAITSLTFGTYCTQSEDSSVKSSSLSSKNKLLNNKLSKQNNNNNDNKMSIFKSGEPAIDVTASTKISKKNINNNLKDNKNINNNENSKENKKMEIKENKNIKKSIINKSKNNNNNNVFMEIKENKLKNIQKTNILNKDKNKNKLNKPENKNNIKNELLKINKNQIEENNQNINKDNNNNNNKNSKIEGEKEEVAEKKTQTNFSDLNILGSKINQLKYREPDESVEMAIPKDNMNKNYNIINNEYNFNDSSVCDEMISFNYETGYNMGRSTTNDYINKIGVKNNVVLSQELYKNKLFMRRNNSDYGKLKIEKSIEASTCCVSCT